MAGDAPDFSVGIVDLSPIVVNTIPIVKNYLGGSVFYFDNFEGPNVTWEVIKGEGADYSFAEIDKTHAYLGTGCARLYYNENLRTNIKLGRRFQFRSSDTIGIEFSFMISDKANDNVEIIYEYKINNTHYTFYIIFKADLFTIRTSTGVIYYPYHPGNGLNNMVWNNVKLIINTKTHRYVKLYYGKEVFNIDHPPQTDLGTGNEYSSLNLGFFSWYRSDPQKSLWLDKVILTDDETI